MFEFVVSEDVLVANNRTAQEFMCLQRVGENELVIVETNIGDPRRQGRLALEAARANRRMNKNGGGI